MLPAGCYTSPAFFAFEREEVFAALDVRWPCRAGPERGDIWRRGGRRAGARRARRGWRDPRAERRVPAPRRDHPFPARGKRVPLSAAFLDLRPPGAPGRGAAHGRRRAVPRLRQTGGCRAALRTVARVRLREPRSGAPPLGPRLAKLEPLWAGYEDAGLVAVPPVAERQGAALELEAACRELHRRLSSGIRARGTHDFAPSIIRRAACNSRRWPGDNAIVRTVPMLRATAA